MRFVWNPASPVNRFWTRLSARLPRRIQSPLARFIADGYNEMLLESVHPDTPGNAMVFGGYLGDSAESWIHQLGTRDIHIFEPVPHFADFLQTRFQGRPVVVHRCGIGATEEQRSFKLDQDSTGSVPTPILPFVTQEIASEVSVQFREVSYLHQMIDWRDRFAVLEINIEGGEYELIALLDESNLLSHFSHILVQFHYFNRNSAKQMLESHRALSRTHNSVWRYPFVWELWERKVAV